MPLYNYKCTECDEVVEVFSSMNNKMKTIDCSSCSSVSHPCFPPQVKKENNKKKQLEFKRPRLTTHRFFCSDCKIRWTEIVERDVDPAPEDTEDYSQYCDRLDNDPAFKDFRIQQDLGLI